MTRYKRMEKEKLGRNYELCEYFPTLQSYFGKRHSILQEILDGWGRGRKSQVGEIEEDSGGGEE